LFAASVVASTPTKKYVIGWPNRIGSNPDSSPTAYVRNRRNALRINDTDIDGNPNTRDARFVYPFSETEPLTPRNGTIDSFSYAMINSNALFYGGMVADVINVNDTQGSFFSWASFPLSAAQLNFTFSL
jgi:hypothetical protein